MVKYDNVLNCFNFSKFTENDLNFFMFVCAKMNDIQEEVCILKYSEIMEAIRWDRRQRLSLFYNEVQRLSVKIQRMSCCFTLNGKQFNALCLFPTFNGDNETQMLKVRINPDGKFILNELKKNFTQFELKEYVGLHGRYTKQLYQNLKQFRATGLWQVSLEDIRSRLSIPESYKTKHIMDKAINPSLEEIRHCKEFEKLQVQVLKSRERGRPVIGYKFTWNPEEIKQPKTQKPKFNDFQQNDYNFDELESMLLESE